MLDPSTFPHHSEAEINDLTGELADLLSPRHPNSLVRLGNSAFNAAYAPTAGNVAELHAFATASLRAAEIAAAFIDDRSPVPDPVINRDEFLYALDAMVQPRGRDSLQRLGMAATGTLHLSDSIEERSAEFTVFARACRQAAAGVLDIANDIDGGLDPTTLAGIDAAASPHCAPDPAFGHRAPRAVSSAPETPTTGPHPGMGL